MRRQVDSVLILDQYNGAKHAEIRGRTEDVVIAPDASRNGDLPQF
jgi:hypothetical protein